MTNNVNETAQESGGTLGTFAGVFTPSILTILGIILFLRMGFVVGSAGLLKTMLILGVATAISVLTSLSLSAVATNMRVKGGGDYFLISRTLGVSFGGALGIVLFLAQSVSIAFYAIGFGEALTAIIGWKWLYAPQVIAAVATLGVFGLAWLGADWASRFQYVVMGALVFALLSFVIGAAMKFDSGLLAKNMVAPKGGPSFWIIFAIFFPAVTGFTQGVSMSGDLRDPGKSLPSGTFAAVGVSTVVYLLVAILFAATTPAQTLMKHSGAMGDISLFGWLIDAGVVAATLSSAIASFMGAPRILQALASDKIFAFLNPFAKGEGESNNPRRGVMLSGVIAMITILLGDLNVIAPVVSMFFLISYGLLNYATFYEADAASPSFRPRFTYFDKRLSLLGALACIGVMLAISPTAGGIALVVLFALYQYLQRSNKTVRWADSQHSHHYKRARSHLWEMAHEIGHPRDWRPQTLVFAEDTPRRDVLLTFASWMEGGSGLTMAVSIVEGSGAASRKQRLETIKELKKEIAMLGVVAYPLVVVAPEKREAAALIMQTAGVGPLRANTSLFNWLEDGMGDVVERSEEERMLRFGQMLRNQVRFGANVCLLKSEQSDWEGLLTQAPDTRRIDVWWWETPSSRLMLLIAYLCTRTDDWLCAKLRVIVPVEEGKTVEETQQHIDRLLDDARIDAESLILETVDEEVLVEQSADASLVMLPLLIRQNMPTCPLSTPLPALLKKLPVTALVLASGEIALDADPDSGPLQELNAARDAAEAAAKRAKKAEKAAADAKVKLAQLEDKMSALAEEKAKAEAEAREAEEATEKPEPQATEAADVSVDDKKASQADVKPDEEPASVVKSDTSEDPEAKADDVEEASDKDEPTGESEEAALPIDEELHEELKEARKVAEDTFKRAAKARAKAEQLDQEVDALAEVITPAAKALEEAEQAAKEQKKQEDDE
jgi:amino acid transporter